MTNWIRWGLIILYVMLSCCLHLWGQNSTDPNDRVRPNIVWITSEDNSKHYLSLFDEHGVPTPHIARLAEHGILFTHAFSNAPVCSVARSTLITGAYGPRIGSNYHRNIRKASLPPGLKLFPEYLREAGYYTTNNNKEDYNVEKSPDVWDESSGKATWKNRASGQPFFHMVNIGVTHEGNLHFSRQKMDEIQPQTPVHDVYVQPNHPQTELFRFTNAYYRDRIRLMDTRLGEIVGELEEDGQLDSTIIFYFGDHGGVLPGSKGYLYETGLHVPLVVYVPPAFRASLGVKAGTRVTGFVSFVDFGPTVLELAGVEVPEQVDGRPFLGPNVERAKVNMRDEAFGYADRFDEKYDMVRSIRKGKYKYIRNFQPFHVDALRNNYRYNMLAYQEWDSLFRDGALNTVQSAFFNLRPSEQLFDVEADPYETQNLAKDPDLQAKLKELRHRLIDWMLSMPDLSLIPEYAFLREGLGNPVEYGQQHQEKIMQYLHMANLSLHDLKTAKDPLLKALRSDDPWVRYWAINAGIALDGQDNELMRRIGRIAKSDPVPINRTQAALYLAIKHRKNPASVMAEALYDAEYPSEGLLILNSIVLMRDWSRYIVPDQAKSFDIPIDPERIQTAVRNEPQVQRRLEYID